MRHFEEFLEVEKEIRPGVIDMKVNTRNYAFKVKVQASDTIRAIEHETKELVSNWLKSVIQKTSLDSLFLHELKVYENSHAYWIPIQEPVLSYLVEEITPGDLFYMYVAFVGGLPQKQILVFALNEFEAISE